MSDGPTLTLERALAREALVSERLRVTCIAVMSGILAGVFLVAVVVSPTFQTLVITTFRPPWLVPLLVGFSLYELAVRVAIGRALQQEREPPVLGRYVNALVEISVPSAALLIAASNVDPLYALVLPMPLGYLLIISLTTLRLDFWLSTFSGAMAAAQYLALVVIFVGREPTPVPILGDPIQHLVKAFMFLSGGVVAGLVGLQLQRQVLASLRLVADRERVVNIFGQHVSPAVVERLLRQDVELGAETRYVCLMFLDIRGFTSFAESRPPGEVVEYLNTLFEFMVDRVNEHGGIVNKFLGDGFMAVFGAPLSDGRDSQNAVAAARAILAQLDALNAAGAIAPTRIGIGLHAGEAMTGTVGSTARKEYTIIGDTVNLASRIEQLTKQYDARLLASDAVWQALGAAERTGEPLGPLAIRGKEAPVQVYRLA